MPDGMIHGIPIAKGIRLLLSISTRSSRTDCWSKRHPRSRGEKGGCPCGHVLAQRANGALVLEQCREDGCGEASEGRGGGKTGCARALLGAVSAAARPAFGLDPRRRALGPVEQSLWALHAPNDARSPPRHQGS